jgi:hypothetical protein
MKEKSKIYFKWLNPCLAIAFFAFLTVSCGEDDNDSEISDYLYAPIETDFFPYYPLQYVNYLSV